MKLSKQKVFDKVTTHLLTQNRRSLLPLDFRIEDASECAYRGENGLKCAVGILIKDEFYHTGYEGKAAGSVEVKYSLALSGININDEKMLSLLSTMQSIHDNESIKNWKDSLKRTAKKFKLKFKGVK